MGKKLFRTQTTRRANCGGDCKCPNKSSSASVRFLLIGIIVCFTGAGLNAVSNAAVKKIAYLEIKVMVSKFYRPDAVFENAGSLRQRRGQKPAGQRTGIRTEHAPRHQAAVGLTSKINALWIGDLVCCTRSATNACRRRRQPTGYSPRRRGAPGLSYFAKLVSSAPAPLKLEPVEPPEPLAPESERDLCATFTRRSSLLLRELFDLQTRSSALGVDGAMPIAINANAETARLMILLPQMGPEFPPSAY
jgi:hypothetical protein